ncbi:D-aminoacyl-tRNA deacylase [Aquilutibacter rugosus]|uniref:D-aminoacyl-tRNA deacylase n=1 Tax=Aquilutibacter rugosus TaxID=3115820 RepID=UPI002F3F13F5
MLALVQRVQSASVRVEGATVGAIGPGVLALIGFERGDEASSLSRFRDRLLGYRMFSDETGRMNKSLLDTGGQLLLVSQFTLAADTRSGMRASFTPAAEPEQARVLFDQLVAICREKLPTGVEIGQFGAHMEVSLVNDGPVTFLLRP